MIMKNWLMEKLKSRKLWIAIATIISVFSGLPEEMLMPLVIIASTYIIGQGIQDSQKETLVKTETDHTETTVETHG